MVDEQCGITTVLDWESSGWFPDYWEYAQMMKWCDPSEHERQEWMTKLDPSCGTSRGSRRHGGCCSEPWVGMAMVIYF